MQAGLELVDQAGQDVYLEAINKSKHMFEQLGFEALKEVELMDGYFQKAMYRKAKPADEGQPWFGTAEPSRKYMKMHVNCSLLGALAQAARVWGNQGGRIDSRIWTASNVSKGV